MPWNTVICLFRALYFNYHDNVSTEHSFPVELMQTGAAEVVHDLFQVVLIHYMWLQSIISMVKYVFGPWAETCNWVWILIS